MVRIHSGKFVLDTYMQIIYIHVGERLLLLLYATYPIRGVCPRSCRLYTIRLGERLLQLLLWLENITRNREPI